MRILNRIMLLLCLMGLFAGCALDKKECQQADWHAYGYTDGSRGRSADHLAVYNQQCAKFGITPDANAYSAGWNAGVRTFCTSANGYNTGSAGYPASSVCPPDVAQGYLNGYNQGLAQYCSPDHALQMGLSGYFYTGVCPADMATAFMERYRLGQDLRQARDTHRDIEGRLDAVRDALRHAKDEKTYRDRLEDLHHLRHKDERSEARLAALNACVSNDWFDAGLSDGENGEPARDHELAGLCASYGGMADPGGYRDGWMRGNARYCSFESGLYAGQAGLDYQGVCNGPGYAMFWSGYIEGMTAFRAGRYADHPRPHYAHATRRAPPPHATHRARHASRRTPAAHRAPAPKAAAPTPAPSAQPKRSHNFRHYRQHNQHNRRRTRSED